MGLLTWIFPSRLVKKIETERRSQRDAEIERMKKAETDKLCEIQKQAAAGDEAAAANLKDYNQCLDDQSVKLLRESAVPKPLPPAHP